MEVKGLLLTDDEADDRLYLIPAWEARNKGKVAREVRLLAEKLLALEEFEWYPAGPDISILWKWKVTRVGCGEERKVDMVSGGLAWYDSSIGEAPLFSALVGRELAYYKDRCSRERFRKAF
jgi:hypothetical protein